MVEKQHQTVVVQTWATAGGVTRWSWVRPWNEIQENIAFNAALLPSVPNPFQATSLLSCCTLVACLLCASPTPPRCSTSLWKTPFEEYRDNVTGNSCVPFTQLIYFGPQRDTAVKETGDKVEPHYWLGPFWDCVSVSLPSPHHPPHTHTPAWLLLRNAEWWFCLY